MSQSLTMFMLLIRTCLSAGGISTDHDTILQFIDFQNIRMIPPLTVN